MQYCIIYNSIAKAVICPPCFDKILQMQKIMQLCNKNIFFDVKFTKVTNIYSYIYVKCELNPKENNVIIYCVKERKKLNFCVILTQYCIKIDLTKASTLFAKKIHAKRGFAKTFFIMKGWIV